MIEELQTYIHREVSDLRGDMVRQFCEQERIIQEQREQIEMLLQLLQVFHLPDCVQQLLIILVIKRVNIDLTY